MIFFFLTPLILLFAILTILLFWPIQLSILLMQMRLRQRYLCNFHHVNYIPTSEPAIVISNTVSLFLSILLRKIAKQPVTLIEDGKTPYGKYFHYLLIRMNIKIIAPEFITSWSGNGILLVHQSFYQKAITLSNTIIPMQVCGNEAMQHRHEVRTPQWLHLSFFEPIMITTTEKIFNDKMEINSIYAWERYISLMPSIPELWIYQAKAQGNKRAIADSTGIELTSRRLLAATLALTKTIKRLLREQENIGICLPPSAGAAMTVMSAFILGKTIVNLNYTASASALNSAISAANIKTIITSGRFIEVLKNKGFLLEEIFSQCHIILLEDLRQQINKWTLLKLLCQVKILSPALLIRRHVKKVSIEHTAAILFSSGSEGKPKGVMLSHKNILGNIKQAMVILGNQPQASILSILPIFHAFGITVTTLLPLLEGVFMICHSDPTDPEILGKMAEKYQPTILCGTSTFFRIYAKSNKLTPTHFSSLRFVIAGAEKLLPEVREIFERKFNVAIHEGYGTTELSPVAAVNRLHLTQQNKIGTVGQSVPGGRIMIIDPETKAELPHGSAGMITFGGVNVMAGYLNDPIQTNRAIFTQDHIRWYQTGDKGMVDNTGYLTIIDRYSRFAKRGGEMISLSAIELEVTQALNIDTELHSVLAVATADGKKGERISLLYTMDIAPDALKKKINRDATIQNLLKPSYYFKVEAIPALGSGKTDFAKAKQQVLKLIDQLSS